MMLDLRRIYAITVKEIRQLARDRLTFGMIVGIPLLQIALFGYAINMDVRHLPAAVVDKADTNLSHALVQNMAATQVVDIVGYLPDEVSLKHRLDIGDIEIGIVIPEDFEWRLAHNQPGAQLLVDGADPTIERIARQLEFLPVTERADVGDGAQGALSVRTFYNPEHRSQVNIVPALIGVILNMTMVLFTAVAIVRERERGNLEFLITTPVSSAELMIGKLVPYIVIGLLQATLILVAGMILFDVPLVGSLLDVYLASLAFIAATLTLGILISTAAGTQFQAMQLMVFTFLPSMLLSGFMFPFDGMPKAAQYIAEILPLTHFVRLIRGIVLRGAGLMDMAMDVYALLIFFAVTLLLSVLRFRKRLD